MRRPRRFGWLHPSTSDVGRRVKNIRVFAGMQQAQGDV
jgi:hypothetical protein